MITTNIGWTATTECDKWIDIIPSSGVGNVDDVKIIVRKAEKATDEDECTVTIKTEEGEKTFTVIRCKYDCSCSDYAFDQQYEVTNISADGLNEEKLFVTLSGDNECEVYDEMFTVDNPDGAVNDNYRFDRSGSTIGLWITVKRNNDFEPKEFTISLKNCDDKFYKYKVLGRECNCSDFEKYKFNLPQSLEVPCDGRKYSYYLENFSKGCGKDATTKPDVYVSSDDDWCKATFENGYLVITVKDRNEEEIRRDDNVRTTKVHTKVSFNGSDCTSQELEILQAACDWIDPCKDAELTIVDKIGDIGILDSYKSYTIISWIPDSCIEVEKLEFEADDPDVYEFIISSITKTENAYTAVFPKSSDCRNCTDNPLKITASNTSLSCNGGNVMFSVEGGGEKKEYVNYRFTLYYNRLSDEGTKSEPMPPHVWTISQKQNTAPCIDCNKFKISANPPSLPCKGGQVTFTTYYED